MCEINYDITISKTKHCRHQSHNNAINLRRSRQRDLNDGRMREIECEGGGEGRRDCAEACLFSASAGGASIKSPPPILFPPFPSPTIIPETLPSLSHRSSRILLNLSVDIIPQCRQTNRILEQNVINVRSL